jgi:hypothetical protein
MGPFDVTITFSRTTDLVGQPMLLDQVAVSMSPQHFKNFCRAASQSLQAYENVFGPLQIPDADTAPGVTAEQLEKLIRDARDRATASHTASAQPIPASSSNVKKQPSKRSRGAARDSS